MLTTDDFSTLGDYAFKSSPESCSTGSFCTDSTDLPSDEDFLQQLSNDLDIPLLLNQGEDELNLLNSFFDRSPDEIMSEIALPQDHKLEDIAEQFGDLQHLDLMQWGPDAFPNLQSDIKSEPSSRASSCSSSNKSPSPIQEPHHTMAIKDELKTEPLSPGSNTNMNGVVIQIQNQNGNHFGKMTPKRVAIQPKTPYGLPQTKNKVVVIKNSDLKINPVNMNSNNRNTIIKSSNPNVVVLESIPITNVTSIPHIGSYKASITTSCPTILSPMVIKDNLNIRHNNNNNIDPRILKRQQRKIKNRESACLSRKKKRDYLTSLENQVKDLFSENQNLKLENSQLKERLCRYESNGCAPINNRTGKNVKNSVIVCMFLLAVGLNLNFVRHPFIGRNQVEVVQSSVPQVSDHHGRNLLWADDSSEKNGTSNFSPFTMCPAAINQTESARLVLELERWIGKPKGSQEVAQRPKPSKAVRTRPLKKRINRKFETRLVQSVYSMTNQIPESQPDNNREIQVFSPSVEQIYGEFFQAINRQDDTFYVVSFSDHHMLLPALHHNKTTRPKMSLIMPAVLRNGTSPQSTLVSLMQIDCEVLDTKLIQVRPGSIPKHLRSQGNSTSSERENEREVKETDTTSYAKKPYKPYFVQEGQSSKFYN